ncbi:hypothetical protein L211DRAFT_845950 [Terfezia boudieri ATCC MYA-4762]|uniref:Uncharacterized protein n=1 Tax=Terfezia boudieri ATCC MYA-4762 TaxID=1051890 RepID=A0A3N4M266_9PEZI|nr:hypothetical protein L211DRAFT_845950 [Terfezia boudieri ATCC MYA-4762]
MQQSAWLLLGQEIQAHVAHPAPAIGSTRDVNIRVNLNLYPPQLTGCLQETGENLSAQQPILSQYFDSVLATLPATGEQQRSPPRLRENIEGSETAGQSAFDRTFESFAMVIPQKPNILHPSFSSTNSAEEHGEASLMLQRYIDHESGKDGGSVYARLFETLDTPKPMEDLHNK